MDVFLVQDVHRNLWYIEPQSVSFSNVGRLIDVDSVQDVVSAINLEVAKYNRRDWHGQQFV